MKKYILILSLMGFVSQIFSQSITILFNPANSVNSIDSIWVTNLATGTKIKLTGDESLMLT